MQSKKFSKVILDYLFSLDKSSYQVPTTISDIGLLNPLQDKNKQTASAITRDFYNKFYNDYKQRRLILGINPGRHGAGLTNIPFTDSKRLEKVCKISARGITSHEPSSVFVYDVIAAYGGTKKFYTDYFIQSVFPLGFVKHSINGKSINYNYFDDTKLLMALEQDILQHLKMLKSFKIDTDIVFCLGTGKNYKYLNQFNKKYQLFDKIIPLSHPRYVMQYKYRKKDDFVQAYLKMLMV